MKLALGTAQFGLNYGIANKHGQTPLHEVKAILQTARNSGIAVLDTAALYGTSEQVLGKAGVELFQIVTKLPPIPENIDNVSEWAQETVKESLRNLKRYSVYAVLLHRPLQLMEKSGPELFDALQSLRAEGWFSKIGLSVYAPSELEQILPYYTVDLVQAPLNVIDQRLISSGWLI